MTATPNSVYLARNLAWADALESGKYSQATAALKTKNGYCCLGVACELSGLSSFKEYRVYDLDVYGYGDVHTSAIPSQEVKDYYGWDGYHGFSVTEDAAGQKITVTLATFNDTEAFLNNNFPYIAKLVRQWALNKFGE